MNTTDKKVFELIDKYAQQKQTEYKPDMLLTDLGYTSFTFVCLIMELEEVYGLTFDDEILNMQEATVKSIAEYVCERAGKNGKG